MELNETEKEILSAIAHLPNNYALGTFVRNHWWPLLEKVKAENPDFDPKESFKIEKKFRGPWR